MLGRMNLKIISVLLAMSMVSLISCGWPHSFLYVSMIMASHIPRISIIALWRATSRPGQNV